MVWGCSYQACGLGSEYPVFTGGYGFSGRAAVVRCVGKSVTRVAPTAIILSYGKVKCNVGVSLGACSTVRGRDGAGLCVCRTVQRSTCMLCKFSAGRRQRLFLLLVSMSNVNNGATHVVLSTLSPSRLYKMVDSNGSGLLGAMGNVNLGATRHVVISLGSGVTASNIRAIGDRVFTGPNGARVRSRTITTLAVLKFTRTTSRGMITTVLGRRPTTPMRGIVGLTLGQLWKPCVGRKAQAVQALKEFSSKSTLFIFPSASLLFLLFLRFTNCGLCFRIHFFLVFASLFRTKRSTHRLHRFYGHLAIVKLRDHFVDAVSSGLGLSVLVFIHCGGDSGTTIFPRLMVNLLSYATRIDNFVTIFQNKDFNGNVPRARFRHHIVRHTTDAVGENGKRFPLLIRLPTRR